MGCLARSRALDRRRAGADRADRRGPRREHRTPGREPRPDARADPRRSGDARARRQDRPARRASCRRTRVEGSRAHGRDAVRRARRRCDRVGPPVARRSRGCSIPLITSARRRPTSTPCCTRARNHQENIDAFRHCQRRETALPDRPCGARRRAVARLSNSLGADLQMWAPQIRPLTQHFNILRYDTRGHGHSDAPAGSYTIEQLAGDVIGLLDHVGIARAHFCGISMGGLTGAALAARFPSRIVRAVLSNTAAKIGSPEVWRRGRRRHVPKGWPRSPTPCCRAGLPTRSSSASRACSMRSATPSCIPTGRLCGELRRAERSRPARRGEGHRAAGARRDRREGHVDAARRRALAAAIPVRSTSNSTPRIFRTSSAPTASTARCSIS